MIPRKDIILEIFPMPCFIANFYKFWPSFLLRQQLDLFALEKSRYNRKFEKRFLSFKFLGIGFSKAEECWWEPRALYGNVCLRTGSSPPILQGQRVFSRLRQERAMVSLGDSPLTLFSLHISQRFSSWNGNDISLGAEVICNHSPGKSPGREQNPHFLCRPEELGNSQSRNSSASLRARSSWMIPWMAEKCTVSRSSSKMRPDSGWHSMQEEPMRPNGLLSGCEGCGHASRAKYLSQWVLARTAHKRSVPCPMLSDGAYCQPRPMVKPDPTFQDDGAARPGLSGVISRFNFDFDGKNSYVS